ncbi:unnamed protein product, partial [Brassica oleracea]
FEFDKDAPLDDEEVEEEGMWEDVAEMVNEMVRRGISPDVCTYNTLISRICKDKELSEAMDVYGSMINKGPEPNLQT